MKRIYLIDCPGVVPPSPTDSEEDILMRGVVRVENVQNPGQYIDAVLKRCKPHHIERTYGVRVSGSATDLLDTLAKKGGRLLKGGEADANGVARMILNDFLRGKLPWFTAPPANEADTKPDLNGRLGRLGEMGLKRKRDQTEPATKADDAHHLVGVDEEPQAADDNDDDEFEGFGDRDDVSRDDDDDERGGDALEKEVLPQHITSIEQPHHR